MPLGPPIDRGPDMTSSGRATPSVYDDMSHIGNDLHTMSRAMEREAAVERLTEAIDDTIALEREAKADLQSITAPTTRAGYLVAGVVGLLLFWFLTSVVFDGNKIATGALIIFTALFFLFILKKTLEKKGSNYIAGTGGAVLGI